MRLNLGCGIDIKEGYLNVDYVKADGIDKVVDLNRLPWDINGQFDEIYASHVLEHLDLNWFSILNELSSLLKKDGILIVKVPHFSSPISFEPFHTRFFRYTSFDSKDEQKGMKSLDQTKTNFKVLKRAISFGFFSISNSILAKIYEKTFLKNIFPAKELIFVLKKTGESVYEKESKRIKNFHKQECEGEWT